MEESVPLRVHPALIPYVGWIRGYRLSGFRPGRHIGVPSTLITCVIDLCEPLRVGQPDGQIVREVASASGLFEAPITIHHDGYQHGVMLMLTPLGVRALGRMPAAELAGTTVALREVLGPGIDPVVDRMRERRDWSCLNLLQDALLRRLPDHRPDQDALALWHDLARRDVREPLDRFMAGSGWSERFVRTRLRAELGLGPGGLRRLLRFERSLRVAEPGNLAQVAVDAGYADHAHLTREWRRYLGLAPSAYLSLQEFVPAA